MPNNVSFFAIQADDVNRARRFYSAVFATWRFEPWGPPGFYLIHTGDEQSPGILGAMHQRHEPATGNGTREFLCTISVDDIDATIGAIEANGGSIANGQIHHSDRGHRLLLPRHRGQPGGSHAVRRERQNR